MTLPPARLSQIESAAAGVLCVGFHGTEVPKELKELIRRGVRSFVLFSRNLGEPKAVLALTHALRDSCSEPITIAVDQEGGAVQRLRHGFTELPPMRALGNAADPELARSLGRLLGRELSAVGVNWNFAPVLDVDTNPNNPVIGSRSLSSSPALVASLGSALLSGMQEVGIAACGKHFPGHGDTELDSHRQLPRLSHDRKRLEAVELLPFVAAVREDVASIMTAHVLYSPLDPEYPATLSPKFLRGLLREDLGYRGLVVSDDLEMKAIVDHYGIESAVVLGIQAGIDVLLICHTVDRMHAAIDGLCAAVQSGALDRKLLLSANARRAAFASRWAAPKADPAKLTTLRDPRHLALADRLRDLAARATQDPTSPG